MEHSLHADLKRFYAGPAPSVEVVVDGYRIDATSHGWLIEIQQGPLWAIRRKTQALLDKHRVLVVKPIVMTRTIARLEGEGGQVISYRKSPKEGHRWDVFEDLVHFAKVFPHPRLRIDVAFVDVVEYRYPRQRRSWRRPPYQLADRQLVQVRETVTLMTPDDMRLLLPELPEVFDSADLAAVLAVPRWRAQQVAYCLRETGAVQVLGRTRRGWRYSWRPTQPAPVDHLSLLVA
jgi:hypothetical protein